MPANFTPDADGYCWTDWSPCTVSCVPQEAAYFARQWRKQIDCYRLYRNHTLKDELEVNPSSENYWNDTYTNETYAKASFRPCTYKLPICQLPPEFLSVHWNNLVYMRILVLALSSLFVLIPTLIVCIKYRRHAHPFVWLNQHAASLRDLTERSDNLKSAKLDLRGSLTPNACTRQSNGGMMTTTQTTTLTSADSKSKAERKGKTVKRNTEWSKDGKSIDANMELKVVTPPSVSPFNESVSAHEFFTTGNIDAQLTKNAVATTTVDNREKAEKTQESRTNEGSVEETAALLRRNKSLDNNFTQENTQNDILPQFEGLLVKGDVGARNEEKIDLGEKKDVRRTVKEEEKIEETQGITPREITPTTPREG